MSDVAQGASAGESIDGAATWKKLSHGVRYALAAHASQTRKGSDTPYISHLLAVASIVLEFGGDEDQAIAAMLHDTIEDQGAHHEQSIRAEFGDRVGDIVRGCTDADTFPKPPWRARKQAYIDHLLTADRDTLLVSAADKFHNVRAICSDLRQHGDAVFDRFRGGKTGTLWYYGALGRTFRNLMPGALSEELWLGVRELYVLSGVDVDPTLEQHRDPGARARSQWEAFYEQLADVCFTVAPSRIGALAQAARQHAEQRAPLITGSEWTNLFDEYALLLARDELYIIEIYHNVMRGICDEVVSTLSEFERELLQRATEEYRNFWRDDEPEPSVEDARRWLVGEMCGRLCREAINHGQDMVDAETDEDTHV